MDILLKLQESFKKCTWKGMDQFRETFARVESFEKDILNMILGFLEKALVQVQSEMAGSWVEGLSKIESLSASHTESLLLKLIGETKKASEDSPESCKDRMDQDPKKYFGAISEQGSDFAYMVCSKMSLLQPLVEKCQQSLHKAQAHACWLSNQTLAASMEAFDKRLGKLDSELATGRVAVAKMLLADLIVTELMIRFILWLVSFS